MKRIIALCFAIIGLCCCTMAHPVDQETAKDIAVKFMGANDVQLSTTYMTDNDAAAFYVFNTPDGFVIVAADDCETPIIGYSHEGRFNPNDVPVQMEDYLQDFVARIQYGVENHIEADKHTARQWELVKTKGQLNDRKDAKSVEPLLTEKWHQGCLYNSLCPEMSGPCDHAEVGCVAVAMAQIMHYWGYPASGWGTHSYYNQGVVLSADFGNTTYDWEHMPDSLTENSSDAEIEAVATLLYHCGVSVNMDYSLNGSNANSANVTNAMRRYFSFSRKIHRERKNNYNDAEWLSLLKKNLDSLRPIYYSGNGSAGGHAFVCDGYDSNDLLHFNWGWGGNGDGYFALGNLNPIGYSFNSNNYAIIDITPEYEPCIVSAAVYPPTAGFLEGTGEYHIGDSCTLMATPAEDYEFYCWKKDGQIISNTLSLTLDIEQDTINIEAHFSCKPVDQLTANYAPDADNQNSPNVRLSWNRADTEWTLLKQFETDEEGSGMATDGEHIYITYGEWNHPPFAFGKYSKDGELIERFNLRNDFDAVALDYDGTSYYCNTAHSGLAVLYRVDFDNKLIIDSLNMGHWFGDITYDPEYNGFWLDQNFQTILYDHQGQIIQNSPTLPDFTYGSGYYKAKDGNPHLFLTRESGVYDFDITNNVILDRPLLNPGWDYTYGTGACIGKFDGKDAMFIAIDYAIRIYEIKSRLEQITGYRIYRADSEGHNVMLADEIIGTTFLDETWNNANAGAYRFGISEVYYNGIESEIIWSEPIVKTNHGIYENNEDSTEVESSVQKVIENGQVIIIKDGKRYNVSGQRLK